MWKEGEGEFPGGEAAPVRARVVKKHGESAACVTQMVGGEAEERRGLPWNA